MANKILTGLRSRCPSCGRGKLFGRYMEVRACDECRLDLRASNIGDGLSTIIFLLLGGLGCLGIIWSERAFNPPIWLLMVVWLPLIGVLCVIAQQPFKSLMVALLYRNQAYEAVTRSSIPASADLKAPGEDQPSRASQQEA